MVNRKAVFAWLFPFKFDYTRSQAVVHTYFRFFKIMMYNSLFFPEAISAIIMFWWVLSESYWYYRIV